VDGITVEDIGAALTGRIQTVGTLNETWLNTSGLTAGSVLYLSTSGNYTETQPTSGFVIKIGKVGVVATSSGSIILSMPAYNIDFDELSGDVDLTTQVTGVLPVANGGTGETSYTNGQLLVGNSTGNTLDKATLTAGEGIDINTGPGSITISGENATTSNKGVASFDSNNFTVSFGTVSLKDNFWTTVFDPQMSNGWIKYSSSWPTLQYRKEADGSVRLRGLIRGGTIGTTIYTLPVGYRPALDETWAVASDTSSGTGRVSISSSGTIVARSGSNSFFSLSGVVFDT
jgi:hypothetical protein